MSSSSRPCFRRRPSQGSPQAAHPRRFFRLAGLLSNGFLLLVGSAEPVSARFAYGISDKQHIHQINVDTGRDNTLFDASPFVCVGLSGISLATCRGEVLPAHGFNYYSNGFAYDESRRQFFFLDYQANLRMWDFSSTSVLPVIANKDGSDGKPSVGLATLTIAQNEYMANAAFYNDAYWYFISSDAPGTGSDGLSPDATKLVRFAMTYDAQNRPNGGQAYLYSVGNLPYGTGTDPNLFRFGFGDIAINPNNQTLYGALTNGAFFTVDLSDCAENTGSCGDADVLIAPWDGVSSGANPSLQLAFEDEFSRLYGQTWDSGSNGTSTSAGGWGLVDVSTGRYSEFSGPQTVRATPLRDVAGTSPRDAVPGPLPLLGAGAALGWSRRLRRRLRSAQAGPSSR